MFMVLCFGSWQAPAGLYVLAQLYFTFVLSQLSNDKEQVSYSQLSVFFCLQSAIGRLLLQSHPAPPPSPSSQWQCKAAPSRPKTHTLTSRTVAVRPTASQDAATPLTVSVAYARAAWQRGPILHQSLSLLLPLLQPRQPLQALYLLSQPPVTSLLPPPLSPPPPPPLPTLLPHPLNSKMTPWAFVSP